MSQLPRAAAITTVGSRRRDRRARRGLGHKSLVTLVAFVAACSSTGGVTASPESTTTVPSDHSSSTLQRQSGQGTTDVSSPQVPAELIMEEIDEPACDLRVDETPSVSGTPFDDFRAALTADALSAVRSEHPDKVIGHYPDRASTRLVVVVTSEALEWARSNLPWLIEGSLRTTSVPVVIQVACDDLPRLRSLRDAVLNDPRVQKAVSTSGSSVGVGFSINANSMRLQVLLDSRTATNDLVNYLEETFGPAGLDVGTVTLLSGRPG